MRWLAIVVLVVGALWGVLGSASASPSSAVPTPTALNPSSIYEVRSLESAQITVSHTFKDNSGATVYTLTDVFAAGESRQYHVATMNQIPSPWVGTLDISTTCVTVDACIAADVIGYDYRGTEYRTSLPIIKR